MGNQLRRCCDCNFPIGNRDKFCPRCGTRQPREPGVCGWSSQSWTGIQHWLHRDAKVRSHARIGLLRLTRVVPAGRSDRYNRIRSGKILNKIKYLRFNALGGADTGINVVDCAKLRARVQS